MNFSRATRCQWSFLASEEEYQRNGVHIITSMSNGGHKSEHMHRRYNHVSESDLLTAASKINTYVTPAQSFETSINHKLLKTMVAVEGLEPPARGL